MKIIMQNIQASVNVNIFCSITHHAWILLHSYFDD